jgi:MFS family permease
MRFIKRPQNAGSALTFRDFRLLWLGTVFMNAGIQMQAIVRGYFVYDLTASPIILGIVSTGFAVPMLFLALFGGQLADRLPRKRIIQISQGISVATAVYIGISISTETITWIHLLCASLVTGVTYAFMVPARTALIPVIVSDVHAGNAFAINAAAMSTTTLLAPAIAGNLYAWIGADGVYYTVAAMQLGAVLCTGMIRQTETRMPATDKTPMQQIGAGLRYIGENRVIVVLIATAMATALLSMPFRSLLPIYVVDVFGQGPKLLGLLVSLSGIGAIAGALYIASWGTRRRGLILLIGGFISATGLVVAASFTTTVIIAICMAVVGFGDAIRRSLAMALIMESTDREYQGRVASVYTMNFGLMPLGTLPASALTEAFGVRFATAVLGVLLLAILSYIITTQKKLRNLQ